MLKEFYAAKQHNMSKIIKEFFLGNLNKKTISIMFINILTLIILLLIGAVQFETIDDYMIYELLSGKWGQATNFVVYVNIFLASALVWLFKIIPSINWYVLMLLITHIISFTILGRLINKKYKNGMLIYLIVLGTMYIPLLIFLQYTSQAAMLILVGCLYATNIIMNKEKKYKLIFAGALILFGSLIRFGALLYVLPYVFLIYVINLFKKKLSKQEIIVSIFFYLIVGISCLTLKYIHQNIYNNNPIYSKYLEYSSVRTLVHDYLANDYDENSQMYNFIGWSENDYKLMALFNNADELVFSKEKLEYITQNVKIHIKTFKEYASDLLNIYVFPYLLIMILLTYNSVKEGKKENILIVLLAIVIELAFITMVKINFRTCVLNYMVAIIFMCCELREVLFVGDKYIKFFLITIITILLLGANLGTFYLNNKKSLAKSYNDFLIYASENKENAYIYSVRGLNNRHLKKNILSTYEQPVSNVCPIASWLSNSENYLNFKQEYNISEMYLSLVDKSNVYLVVSNYSGESGAKKLNMVITYLKEHYSMDNIQIAEVTNFNGQIYVYKFTK